MVHVLYIGNYEKAGRFHTIQWEFFIDWCKKECNKVVVYSKMSFNTICEKFPLHCKIDELEKPDKDLNINTYEINVINLAFWDFIKNYNYNIDRKDDISHMFFFQKEKYIASLEIVDYENYILIEEPFDLKDDVIKEELILTNYRFCLEGKSDIDDLVQEESWKPLGYINPLQSF